MHYHLNGRGTSVTKSACSPRYWKNHLTRLTLMAAVLVHANIASAFRVLDLTEDGMGISRWNAAHHTVDGVERSLDGGIRFSMTGGSYEAFSEEFNWKDGIIPTVAEFQTVVEDVFAEWEQVDPATGLGTDLRFVPDFGTEVVRDDHDDPFQLAEGSEFDLIAADVDFLGGSRLFGDPSGNTVTLTSGVENYPAAVISGADLVFGTDGGDAGHWTLSSFRSVFSQMVGLSLGMEWADLYHDCDDCFPVSPF